jgi:hypothetical protein
MRGKRAERKKNMAKLKEEYLQRLVANAQKNYNQGHNENCSV